MATSAKIHFIGVAQLGSTTDENGNPAYKVYPGTCAYDLVSLTLLAEDDENEIIMWKARTELGKKMIGADDDGTVFSLNSVSARLNNIKVSPRISPDYIFCKSCSGQGCNKCEDGIICIAPSTPVVTAPVTSVITPAIQTTQISVAPSEPMSPPKIAANGQFLLF